MDKIVLKDGTEIEIHEGASISSITTNIYGYEYLETLSKQLTTENLSEVKFTIDDKVTGIYENMVTTNPKFQIQETDEGWLEVTFGLRERTADELHYEDLSRQVTDAQVAIAEIYETM